MLFVLMLCVPSVGFASQQYSLSDVRFDSHTAPACTDFEQCPEYRTYLLELIAELIEILKELQEAQTGLDTDAEIEIDTERVVVDIDSDDISDLRDVTYTVLSGGRLSGESRGDVPQVVLDVWNDFTVIASEETINQYVSSLRAYHDEDDLSAAYVQTDENDYTKWVVAFNIADYDQDSSKDKKQFHQTLVHEFAHILTLNEDQLDLTTPAVQCGIYYVGEGCLYVNSYLAEFVEEFWEDEDFDHAEDYLDEDDEDKRDEMLQEFFDENEDEYVTAYATSHPAEDIAESFALYVTEDLPEDDEDERDEKLLFFDGFSELRAIRDRIRQSFTAIYN